MSESDAEISAAFIDAVEASLGDLVPKDLFALARRGAAVQWRPIEEAPKDGTCIMVGAGKWEPEVACWSDSVWLTGWYCGGGRSDSYGPSFNPTHFMPLPPPPAGETSDE